MLGKKMRGSPGVLTEMSVTVTVEFNDFSLSQKCFQTLYIILRTARRVCPINRPPLGDETLSQLLCLYRS